MNVQFVLKLSHPVCDLFLAVKISSNKQVLFAFTSSNSSRSPPLKIKTQLVKPYPRRPLVPQRHRQREKRDSTKKESAPITLALSVQSILKLQRFSPTPSILSSIQKKHRKPHALLFFFPPSSCFFASHLCRRNFDIAEHFPPLQSISLHNPRSQCPPNPFSKLTARPSSTTTSHAPPSSDLLLSPNLESTILLPSSPHSTSRKTKTYRQCSTRQRLPTHGYLLPA
jgi:hypothetical protein